MSTVDDLRKTSDEGLAKWMAGWQEHTPNYILAEMEFKRRLARGNEIRGWISLGISIAALVLSIVAIVGKTA